MAVSRHWVKKKRTSEYRFVELGMVTMSCDFFSVTEIAEEKVFFCNVEHFCEPDNNDESDEYHVSRFARG